MGKRSAGELPRAYVNGSEPNNRFNPSIAMTHGRTERTGATAFLSDPKR